MVALSSSSLFNLGQTLLPSLSFNCAICARRRKGALESIGLSRDVWDTLEILTMDADQALHAEHSFAELPADQKARFTPKISGLDPSKMPIDCINRL